MVLKWQMLMIYLRLAKRYITINVIQWSLKNQLLKIDQNDYFKQIITFASKLISIDSIHQSIFLFLRMESIYGD